MEISFSKVKQLIRNDEEANYGQFVDLELLLEDLRSKNKEMTGEEAVLQFLYEITKIY